MLSRSYDAYQSYQAVAEIDEIDITDGKREEKITTILSAVSTGAQDELDKLFTLEKFIKRSLKTPFIDNIITAILATLSLVCIVLEIRGLLTHYSLDEVISRDTLVDNTNPVGAFHEYSSWLTYIAVGYSLQTLKYSRVSLPDEIIGEVKRVTSLDVSRYNKTSMLALVRTLINLHEKKAEDRSDDALYRSLRTIRQKLNSHLQWNERLLSTGVWGLRSIGVCILAAGLFKKEGEKGSEQAAVLLAYLTSGLLLDGAFLLKLASYYIPSTEKILDDTEINIVKRALKNETIHKIPANRALHAIRRHSICFFSATVQSEQKGESNRDMEEDRLMVRSSRFNSV